MKAQIKNRLAIGMPVVYLLLTVLMLLAMDKSVVTLLENAKTINLSQQASLNSETIGAEISSLEDRTEQVRVAVSDMAGRTFPALNDIKQLQLKHRLNLVQIERVSSPDRGEQGPTRYTTVLSGTVGSTVRFLKELEEKHVVKSDLAVLRPANEDGSEVALTISLEVADQ